MRLATPVRVRRSYIQRLIAVPDVVFPLLCPVREADWIDGWDPLLVVTASGVAEPECVFVTAGEPADAVWCIVRHVPAEHRVEMIKVTPGVTVGRLWIHVRAVANASEAVVTCQHTSLGPAGDAYIAGFTDEHFQAWMRRWEHQLNHYLGTGQRLPAGDGR